jgi:ribonuclease D
LTTLIQSQSAFDELLAAIGADPIIAVDTEAASFHRYLDRIYLVQISSRGITAVVDPLAITDLGGLGAILADPAREIIFHDADYDLRILNRDYGFTATHLFDTRIAAQLLNEPGVGLAALLEKYLRVRLDKKFQRADWSIRPLSAGMLDYAAADTHYLPALRDLLREKLEQAGRWSWAVEEFRLLEEVRWTTPGPAAEAYLRMKGAKTLKGRALLVLRDLYAWRESVARELDRATFRVMSNEVLLAMAETPPTTLAEIRAIKGVSVDLVTRRGADILGAIRRGQETPASEIPVFERTRRPSRDPEFDAALDRLKLARNEAAVRLGLAPGVLCPNGALEAVARARPTSQDEVAALPGFRRWQAVAIGAELVQALTAPGK